MLHFNKQNFERSNRNLVNHSLVALFKNHIITYPTPSNLTIFWSFGSLAGLFLVIQLITGIFLAMHYSTHVDLAFFSVENIMRNVAYGWLVRYAHANGASFFFIVVYLHIFRGIYFGSYIFPRHFIWMSGLLIFLLMMATAFMGYVLPWGQMSFWGATVITNLFSAIPLYGSAIVQFLWGGFSVDNATLNRFFSLHYLLPFVIAGLTLVHLALLHNDGSNNPLGLSESVSFVPFFPYFYIKDLFFFWIVLLLYFIYLFYYPNNLGHPDNYIPANPMVTPEHIVPEWYFLPFYAILRSIPNKLGGVLAMFGSIAILFLLPFLNTSKVRSREFRPFGSLLFWFLVGDFFVLGWIGQQPVEAPFIGIGVFATVFYFLFFMLFEPACGHIESKLILASFENQKFFSFKENFIEVVECEVYHFKNLIVTVFFSNVKYLQNKVKAFVSKLF